MFARAEGALSEPTVNRSIARWAMSALFARTVSPSRRMGDVPSHARARLCWSTRLRTARTRGTSGGLLFGFGAEAVAAGESFF